jgi:hypothetical protein
METVAPSERFRCELDEVLAAGARGRGHGVPWPWSLERTDETVARRNGHEPRTVKTMSGTMRLERPRVRDAKRLGFESRILGRGVARTLALDDLGASALTTPARLRGPAQASVWRLGPRAGGRRPTRASRWLRGECLLSVQRVRWRDPRDASDTESGSGSE